WIPIPGGMTTFFRSWLHDPSAKIVPSLGHIDNVKLDHGVSYIAFSFGTYDGSAKNDTNMAFLPVPRPQQNGKATLLVVNMIKGSETVSVVDGTGKTIKDMSQIKFGDFHSISDINPVTTSLHFVDDTSGKSLMQFATFTIEADQIYSVLLVGTL